MEGMVYYNEVRKNILNSILFINSEQDNQEDIKKITF